MDVADDGRLVEAAAVREGDEQRESSVSEGVVEVSEVNEEWRVTEGIIGRGLIGSDSLSADEELEASSSTGTTQDGTVEAKLIAKKDGVGGWMATGSSGKGSGRSERVLACATERT